MLHALLRAIGVLALLAGLAFIGHGFRFSSYPGVSAMTSWIYSGMGIATIGLLLIVFSKPSDQP